MGICDKAHINKLSSLSFTWQRSEVVLATQDPPLRPAFDSSLEQRKKKKKANDVGCQRANTAISNLEASEHFFVLPLLGREVDFFFRPLFVLLSFGSKVGRWVRL
jgi:hypothetical protein